MNSVKLVEQIKKVRYVLEQEYQQGNLPMDEKLFAETTETLTEAISKIIDMSMELNELRTEFLDIKLKEMDEEDL